MRRSPRSTTSAAAAAAALTLALALAPAISGCDASRPAASGDAVAASDASASDATARPDASVADALVGPFEGLVYIAEVRDFSSGAQQGTALASFLRAPHPFFREDRRIDANCAIYGGEGNRSGQLSVGTLRVSGGTRAFELSPAKSVPAGGYLYPGLLNPDYFDASSNVVVKADGATLPAFSGSVRGVDPLSLKPPPSLRRGQAAPIGFASTTGQRQGNVWVLLVGAVGGKTSGPTVRCEARLADGSFVIPASAIAALPAAATAAVIAVGAFSRTAVSAAPDFTVELVTVNLTTVATALR